MADRSLFDQLLGAFGNAVTDVREKLVEEAWFGRTTAAQERMSHDIGEAVAAKDPPAGHESTRAGQPQALSLDQMAAQLAKDRGYEPEPDIDHDRER